MRLTKKDIAYITSGVNVIEIPDIVEGHKYTGQAVIKLGQLEDIEEELGIDLITLFKAFNHIYYKKDNEIKMACHIALVDWTIYILDENMTIGEGISLRICDYEKTWALTKEELENDN